jgi:hypothetical protein
LSDEPILVSFRHETIGEFLIGSDIISAFAGDSERLAKSLAVTVADDVNTFVRSGLQLASRATIRRYLQNLSMRYSELRPSDTGELAGYSYEHAERLREQILYYIGRLPLENFPDILRDAFRTETAPLLRRSAALGAIIFGDFSIERQYMILLDDPQEALLNRSVQMVYFADVHDDLHTFRDSGQDWGKTRAAIFRRLTGTSLRDIRLRWWDLKTLRSFYESRQYRDVPSDYEIETLRDVILADPASEERSEVLRREHDLLTRALGL